MARKSNLLTARAVASKPSGWHADGNNLYLLVSDTGSKSWVFRYKVRDRDTGKDRVTNMGLGSLKDLTLVQAREEAAKFRTHLEAGLDPKGERDRAALIAEEEADLTFEAAARQYVKEFVTERRFRNPKHRQQWANTLTTYAYPIIGKMQLAQIGPKDIHRVLKPIWSEKHETASRLRGRIENILNWATAKEWRSGDNPAKLSGPLEHLLGDPEGVQEEHHAAMPFAEVPAFLDGVRSESGMGYLALEFAILTAARSGEVLGAVWSEIDLEAGLWTVPQLRMKAKKEHVVPLSSAAVAVLQTAHAFQRKGEEWVFPGMRVERPLSNMAMAMAMRRLGEGGYTVHGFRSSFRDWASETTDHPNEVVEMALAHTIANKVEAAYRRGNLLEKRRQLMADWATFCVPVVK